MQSVCFLVLVLSVLSQGAPQGRKISHSNAVSQSLTQMLNLQGPFASAQIGIENVTLPLAQEFFKHKGLVNSLVDCFDIYDKECQYPGIQRLVDQIGVTFNPSQGCRDCAPNIREVVQFASKQFQGTYKRQWKRFVILLSDFLGGIPN